MQSLAFGKNPFILIVDDVPKNLQLLGSILGSKNYNFTPATSGEQALKIVNRILPDLILLDIMMPEMDGYEVCKRLKKSARTKEIPIIFLTAKASTEDIVRGFEAGGVDYITKPFNSTELLARIKTHLEIVRIGNERKELLHVLCHDLANPFSSIVTVLKAISDSSKFDRYKDLLLASADNGLRVIQLVREMRALDENKTNFKLGPVNLRKVLTESTFMLSLKFNEKRIEIDMDVDPDLLVVAERTSFLNSVVNNIFTNAVKFSFPDSKIEVGTCLKDDMAEIRFRDHGIGMSEELLKDLFDIKKSTTRKGTEGEMGTGFGMPLVKKFVTAYGGAIDVFSKEKSGGHTDFGTEVKLTLKKA